MNMAVLILAALGTTVPCILVTVSDALGADAPHRA
jgi:hypothetical protein